MVGERDILVRAAARTMGMVALVGLGAALTLVDVLVIGDGIRETSLTEIGQEAMLFIIALLFFLQARRPGWSGFGALVGGFFGCMFIRELDGPLDTIVHGLWKYPAWLLAIVCVVFGWRDRRAAVSRFAEFVQTQPFATMAAGLSVILVFSRLIGIPELWQGILGQGYIKTAKHAVEEGTETLGYSLCLAATLDYLWSNRSVAGRSAEALAARTLPDQPVRS